MIHSKHTTLESARESALQASRDNPKHYVTLFLCFGLEVCMSKSLNVFAPSDSYGGTYWFNGKEKSFTEKQIIKDSMNWPAYG